MGRKIGQAEGIRHASDYDDFYTASKEESERQISVADEFVIYWQKKYCLEQLGWQEGRFQCDKEIKDDGIQRTGRSD